MGLLWKSKWVWFWCKMQALFCFSFYFQPPFCSTDRKVNPGSSWSLTSFSSKVIAEFAILHGVKTWDLLATSEGVIGWGSTALVDGISSLLVCMSPSEPEALFSFQITFRVPGCFANLPVSLPDYPSHHDSVFAHWQEQCLEFRQGIFSTFRVNSWTQQSYFLF